MGNVVKPEDYIVKTENRINKKFNLEDFEF